MLGSRERAFLLEEESYAPASPARLTVAVVVGIVTLQALMLLAFAWPAANVGPRELPIAVAGPPQAVEQVEASLAAVPGPDDEGGV